MQTTKIIFSAYKLGSFTCESDQKDFKIGDVLHFKSDSNGNKVICNAIENDKQTYCVTGVSSSHIVPPRVSLTNLDNYIQGRPKYYKEILGERITTDSITKAINHVKDTILINKLYMTETYRESFLYTIDSVISRIELCRELISENIDETLKHKTEPLVIYLLLTCFDKLGQPEKWVNYNEWLTSEGCKGERKSAKIDFDSSDGKVCEAKFFYDYYNKIYSARSAFFRFLREVLPNKSKEELMSCIEINIYTLRTERELISSYEVRKKEEFLYQMRNDYTHKVQFLPDQVITGMQLPGNPPIWKIFYQDIILEKRKIKVSFTNWPQILESIILDGLAESIKKFINKK